jgi:hypothetical protein
MFLLRASLQIHTIFLPLCRFEPLNNLLLSRWASIKTCVAGSVDYQPNHLIFADDLSIH